jgi:cGMP-dependent protein kinase
MSFDKWVLYNYSDLLSNEDSQFYIGSMILAVEYLHKRKIVYRDIKPENIMIDDKGYLKLIDMGTAKILKSDSGVGKTFTILGTPHYMAPEILKGKGYGLVVDLWSIGKHMVEEGVTLYEFMCGMVPYGEECEDPYEVYQLILNQNNLSYPAYFLTKENKVTKIFIEQLLNRVPDIRLGGTYASLKAHKWFDKFDWVK